MDFSHVSVLLKETVGNLITDPNGIYVDGTLGCLLYTSDAADE